MRTIQFNLIRKWWTRTYQRHIATQNIEELWQFIDTGLSNKSTHFRNTIIIPQLKLRLTTTIQRSSVHVCFDCLAMPVIVAIVVHGTKLEQVKFFTIQPHPLLTEE